MICKLNKIQKVYSFLWMLYFLQSMFFMYLWEIPGGIIGLVLIYISINYKKQLHLKYVKWQKWVLLGGIISFCISYELSSFAYAVNIVVLPICIYYLIQTPNYYKTCLLRYIMDIFYYIMIPSLPFFLLHALFNIVVFDLGNTTHEIYTGTNCLFYFYQPFYGIRYTSYFLEPGHLGMILSIMLYTQDFDIRNKKNLYLLINLLFTLSLAAYVLCFIGFIFKRISMGLLNKRVVGFFLFLFVLYLIASSIPVIKNLIIDRLLFDSDTGTISGDNRINGKAAMFFYDISFRDFMFGIGRYNMDKIEVAGTGFIIHVIEHGFISVLCILFYYLIFFFRQKVNVLNVGLLLLYIFSFYQRSYALWASELVMFVCYVGYSNTIKRWK